ncbi:MAG: beta-propeller fold lactonase family protein [Spirochaetota bacterium]
MATLTMSFGSSPRAFAPPAAEIDHYTISAAGPDGASMASESIATVLTLELLPGEWSISAEGLAKDGRRLVSGSVIVRLSPGERQNATIILLPEGGTGSLVVSWSTRGDPGVGTSLEGSITTAATSIPLSASGTSGTIELADIPSGSWTLEARLSKDALKVAGLADSILIVSGCETTAVLVFEPPVARMALSFVGPSFKAETALIAPPVRRIALGALAGFEHDPALGSGSWFKEGSPTALTSASILMAASIEGSQRIDWVADSSFTARSGKALIQSSSATAFGPFQWMETVVRSDLGASTARGIDGCRDLLFTPDGKWLFAAGKDGSSVSSFALSNGKAPTLRSSIGKTELPALDGASRLALVPGTSTILVLGETGGNLVALSFDSAGAFTSPGSIAAPELTTARGLVVSPGGGQAWLPSEGADAVLKVDLDADGLPTGISSIAKSGDTGLEAFDRPLCIAVSNDGSELAVGTAGDDAVYLFAINGPSGSLSLLQRVSKESVASIASLSDPVDLAFSKNGSSLFALSYYGKSLIRFDRNGTGMFAATAAAKSGVGQSAFFDYPKRMALDPLGTRIVVSGGGTNDGLSSFSISQNSALIPLGNIGPGTGDALPQKPCALAFSPQDAILAVSLPEEDRLMLFASQE